MDKQSVLEQAKNAMAVLVTEIDLENIEEIKEKVGKYFKFIEVLSSLPEVEVIEAVEEKEVEVETVGCNEESEMVDEIEPILVQEDLQNKRYRFERKLRGGVLPDLGGGYYIPEAIVREIGVEHGDILEIDGSKPFGEQIRYYFKIVERHNETDASGRVEFKYCIVEESGRFMMVRKQAGEEGISYNGRPFSFVLRDDDVCDLNLKKGDVVDAAFYENRSDNIRVVWKHDSSKIAQVLPQIQQTKKETAKETVKHEKELPIDDPQLFNGKKILVVGAKPKEAGYKAILEALGSEVEVYAGTEAKSRTRGAIQRSDVVVMVTAYLGHGKSSGSPQVVEMCKKAKVPFGFVDTMGNESFVRGVEEVLKRKEELVSVS